MSIEIQRPIDGSDLTDFAGARDELLRLRHALGHLAKDNGFAEVVYDGSDLIKGLDEQADFDRCKAEVVHIRACLRLSTQNAKRRGRANYQPTSFFDQGDDDELSEDDDDDDEEAVSGGGEKLEESSDSVPGPPAPA